MAPLDFSHFPIHILVFCSMAGVFVFGHLVYIYSFFGELEDRCFGAESSTLFWGLIFGLFGMILLFSWVCNAIRPGIFIYSTALIFLLPDLFDLASMA